MAVDEQVRHRPERDSGKPRMAGNAGDAVDRQTASANRFLAGRCGVAPAAAKDNERERHQHERERDIARPGSRRPKRDEGSGAIGENQPHQSYDAEQRKKPEKYAFTKPRDEAAAQR